MTIVFQNDQTLQDTFSYHRDVRTYTSEYFSVLLSLEQTMVFFSH